MFKTRMLNSRARFHRLWLPGMALLLGGCSMIPAYERPAAPIAAAWPASASATTGAGAVKPAPEVAWQSYFKDARLRQLIDTALRNNRDLRIALLNIEQARAQFQIRRADQLPTINLAATGNRAPNSAGAITSTYTAGFGVTAFELDLFGRVSSLKEAALAQYLATEEARKTTQISLIAAVANSYLSLMADEELLGLTRQTLQTREESLKLSQARFDYGVSSELDFRQAESLVEAARATLAQLQRQHQLDENALTLLLGQPLSKELWASPTMTNGLDRAIVMSELPTGLPSDLLTQRPDIRAAEQQLLAANANIGAARAAFFPRISLTGSVGSVSTQLSGLFGSDSYGWTFAPQLVLPLFDSGRNQASLASAQTGQKIAVAQYEKAIQTAFREVADALAGRGTLTEQVRALQAQARAEEKRFGLSDLRYRHGVASYLDLLDAQRSLFSIQQALVQTRLAQLQNDVTLYKTLGGGWTAEDVTTGEKKPAN